MRFLNQKQIKEIYRMIEKQFGFKPVMDYLFIMSKDDRIYIANNDLNIDLSMLNVNSIGLYFGRIIHNEFKLTIEGTQLLGKYAKKNVIELTDKEVMDWMHGFNIDKESSHEGFVIIKHNDDFLGCGKHKNNKIFNLVPKERRIVSLRD